jgi:tetratricopeptide (TPR) repeat protein
MYSEASRANEIAIGADQSYINACNAQGFYPLTYYPHNQHFLWYSTGMEGRYGASLAAAKEVLASLTDKHTEVDRLRPLAWFTLVRFGHFDEMLKQEAPPTSQPFATGQWRYAYGLACVAKGNLAEAEKQSKALAQFAESEEAAPFENPYLHGRQQLRTADHVLKGAIAWGQGKKDDAFTQLREAVKIQDALPYMEPPYWYYPVRQSLGGALLKAGKYADAETVFREDLKINPSNGWALSGLGEALEKQGKKAQADEVKGWFERSWVRADAKPVLWAF